MKYSGLVDFLVLSTVQDRANVLYKQPF